MQSRLRLTYYLHYSGRAFQVLLTPLSPGSVTQSDAAWLDLLSGSRRLSDILDVNVFSDIIESPNILDTICHIPLILMSQTSI